MSVVNRFAHWLGSPFRSAAVVPADVTNGTGISSGANQNRDTPALDSGSSLQTGEINMFDFSAFVAKMAAMNAALPAIGTLVQTTELLAPNAAGLTKAGLVINTVIAAEPALIGCEQMLQAAVTGVVNAYRSAGVLATPAPKPPATPVAA